MSKDKGKRPLGHREGQLLALALKAIIVLALVLLVALQRGSP